MKNYMLLASGILLTLSVKNTLAQNTFFTDEVHPPVQSKPDTLEIRLTGSNRIYMIGPELKKMSTFNQGDSVKTLFISDWSKAIEAQPALIESKLVHYFVHHSGKRRLKFESENYVEPAIDVNKELTRLNLDLPGYEYVIHIDDYIEFHVYVKDPATLKNELGSVGINDAVQLMAHDKRELKRNYKMVVSSTAGTLKQTNMAGNHVDAIELTPSFGLGMIGSEFAPVLGFDLSLELRNKYRIPRHKFGVAMSAFGFATFNNSELTSFNPVQAYDIKYLHNRNSKGQKPLWTGIEAGLLKAPYGNKSSLNNSIKVGFISEGIGPVGFAFDLLFLPAGSAAYSLRLSLPF